MIPISSSSLTWPGFRSWHRPRALPTESLLRVTIVLTQHFQCNMGGCWTSHAIVSRARVSTCIIAIHLTNGVAMLILSRHWALGQKVVLKVIKKLISKRLKPSSTRLSFQTLSFELVHSISIATNPLSTKLMLKKVQLFYPFWIPEKMTKPTKTLCKKSITLQLDNWKFNTCSRIKEKLDNLKTCTPETILVKFKNTKKWHLFIGQCLVDQCFYLPSSLTMWQVWHGAKKSGTGDFLLPLCCCRYLAFVPTGTGLFTCN